jgi:uncharacterized protein YukE
MLPMTNPAGDAAGMRSAAAQLRGRADRLSAVIARLQSQTGSMSYTGPAAERFRVAINDNTDQLAEVRRMMAETADILLNSAAQTEANGASAERAQGVQGEWS